MGPMARKVFFILTLVCLIALAGCAEIGKLQRTRTVRDNVFFSSSSPQIRMKINPAFTYLGMTDGAGGTHHGGGLRPAIDDDEINTRQFSYLFAGKRDAHGPLQGVIIRLYTIAGDPSQWSPDPLSGAENIVEKGKIKIDDKSSTDGILSSNEPYRYGIFTATDLFSRKEAALITGKGIEIPGCLLVKTLEKSTGIGNKSQIHIIYFEDIGGDTCNALTKTSEFSDDQTALIGSFVGRSNAAIQFMASEEAGDTPRFITAPPAPEQKEPPASSPADTTPVEGTDLPDIGAKLRTLKQLLNEGLITPEDYERKKEKLLDEW